MGENLAYCTDHPFLLNKAFAKLASIQALEQSFIVDFFHKTRVDEVFGPHALGFGIAQGGLVEDGLDSRQSRIRFFRQRLDGDLAMGLFEGLAVVSF
ncbi:MAG: hypothetical protein ACXWW4_14870 [Candidatus Binatia bacterium]